MSELIDYITERQKQPRKLSDKTVSNYTKEYNRLTKQFNQSNNWVTSTSNKNLINMIKSTNLGLGTQMNYINLFCSIKRNSLQDVRELEEYVKELKPLQIEQKDNNKVLLNETLPSYETIKHYIDDLYNQRDYVNYLVNTLIFDYQFRNKDCNVIIISLSDYKQLKDKTDNYLVYYKDHTTKIIINRYKTSSVYGKKEITTRSRKIHNAVVSLNSGPLLQSAKGQRVTDENLQHYIRTYDSIGEASYFKINIKHAQSQPNTLKVISNMSKNRGTSVDTIISEYNIVV